MSGDAAALEAHLATGDTTVCRCWQVTRRDGRIFGFTDHDRDLQFDGVTFRADTGLSGRAVQRSTGLSVDNSAALGTLSDLSITAEDIEAGRFDNAAVAMWRVNWSAPEVRRVEFVGSIGEITRSGSEFEAELRGLSQQLNRAEGRVFQRQCAATLGDARCGIDLSRPEYSWEASVVAGGAGAEVRLPAASGYPDQWFAGGRLEVTSGPAAGLEGFVKQDRDDATGRRVVLWDSLRVALQAGDTVRLLAGCDRSAGTCRTRFGNFANFRGFPHVPGEDWLTSYPSRAQRRDGGSRLS